MNSPSDSYTCTSLNQHTLTTKHALQINGLLKQLTGKPFFEIDELELLTTMKKATIAVIKNDEDEVVAFGIIALTSRITARECEIQDVIVHDRYRGRGLGKRLLQELLRIAKDVYYAYHVNLTSKPERIEANELYRNIGFIERQTNVYRLKLE